MRKKRIMIWRRHGGGSQWSIQHGFYLSIILLSHWDFSHDKFGLLSLGKPVATVSLYSAYSACWVFQCLYNLHDSDVDYRIFKTCMWSFFMHVHTGGTFGYSLIQRTFVGCRVCTEFWLLDNSLTVSAQSCAWNDNPSMKWPCSIMLNHDFREWVLLLGAITP